MIIWLASYPKSGNTWIRSFINSILFTKDGSVDLNLKIGQYPLRSHFKSYVKNMNDLNEISKFWEETQTKINLDNKVRFFKTHHVFCNINGNNFTNVFIPIPFTPGIPSDLSPSNILNNKKFFGCIPYSSNTLDSSYIFFLVGEYTLVVSSTNCIKSLSVDKIVVLFSLKTCFER